MSAVPDCAIGRRFAPTRWLHPGYGGYGGYGGDGADKGSLTIWNPSPHDVLWS
jgi:hypothetical protein